MLKRILSSLVFRVGSFFAKLIGREPYVTWRELFKIHLIDFPVLKIKNILGRGMKDTVQIGGKRINDDFTAVTFNGHKIFWPSHFSIAPVKEAFRSVYSNEADNYFRFYEPAFTDVVMDLGVCEGVFSLLLADKVKKIYAFEPLPVLCSALRLTLQGGIEKGVVEVCNFAVGDKTGAVDFFFDENLEGGSLDSSKLMSNNTGRISVPLITLDDFVKDMGIHEVSLIKMDIEGAEYSALCGAQMILKEMKPDLLVSAYHYPRDYDRLSKFLAGMGYETTAGPVFMTQQGGQKRPWYRPALIHASQR
jgi:FkbM family methyltransferase